MGIYYKTAEEVELIRLSGDLLGKLHGEISRLIKPGISTKELDKMAFQFINDHKAVPSFLNYRGYPATLCISLNDGVVHGIPGDYILVDGDIVSIDCGVLLNGYHSDSAYTYKVGNVKAEIAQLLKVTKESLMLGIREARHGKRIGDISHAVQSYVEKNGFSVVRELVGHGVGKYLHEEPEVPNFGKQGKGPKVLNGMVLAIEPMVNMGKKEVIQLADGWTIKTRDGKPSAHFEHTVAIVDGKPDVLTTYKYIVEN